VRELLETRAALAHVEATEEGMYATGGKSEEVKKGAAEPVRTFRRPALICRFFLWGEENSCLAYHSGRSVGTAVDAPTETDSFGLWQWRVPRVARMTLCRSLQQPSGRAMQSNSDRDPIEVSLRKRGGEPVFRGTRIPISYLAQYLNHGCSVEDFVEQYDIDPEPVREVYRQKFSDEDERGREVPA
jgi:uncharacterized protein (DUF433 family)